MEWGAHFVSLTEVLHTTHLREMRPEIFLGTWGPWGLEVVVFPFLNSGFGKRFAVHSQKIFTEQCVHEIFHEIFHPGKTSRPFTRASEKKFTGISGIREGADGAFSTHQQLWVRNSFLFL